MVIGCDPNVSRSTAAAQIGAAQNGPRKSGV